MLLIRNLSISLARLVLRLPYEGWRALCFHAVPSKEETYLYKQGFSSTPVYVTEINGWSKYCRIKGTVLLKWVPEMELHPDCWFTRFLFPVEP